MRIYLLIPTLYYAEGLSLAVLNPAVTDMYLKQNWDEDVYVDVMGAFFAKVCYSFCFRVIILMIVYHCQMSQYRARLQADAPSPPPQANDPSGSARLRETYGGAAYDMMNTAWKRRGRDIATLVNITLHCIQAVVSFLLHQYSTS